jgi:hypothetical protein
MLLTLCRTATQKEAMLQSLQHPEHHKTKTKSLTDDVLTVFERACHEEDWHVAQHLLEALETIAQRDHAEDELDQLYTLLAKSLHGKPQH